MPAHDSTVELVSFTVSKLSSEVRLDAVVEEHWRGDRRILGATGRIFTDLPYATASMDDIAAEAGIGASTAGIYLKRLVRRRGTNVARFLSDSIARRRRSGELAAVAPSNVAQMMLGTIRSAAAATDLSDAESAGEVSGLVTRSLARLPHMAGAPGKNTRSGQPAREMKARVPA